MASSVFFAETLPSSPPPCKEFLFGVIPSAVRGRKEYFGAEVIGSDFLVLRFGTSSAGGDDELRALFFPLVEEVVELSEEKEGESPTASACESDAFSLPLFERSVALCLEDRGGETWPDETISCEPLTLFPFCEGAVEEEEDTFVETEEPVAGVAGAEKGEISL
jgi:hypothetical protein